MYFTIFFLMLINIFNMEGAENELLKIQQKFNSVSTFSAKFEGEHTALNMQSQKQSGKIYFRNDDFFRLEFPDSYILSDGKSVWNYNNKQKKVVVSPADDYSNSLSIRKYIYEYPKICSIKPDKNEKNVLILVPKSKNIEFEQIKIWYDKSYIINKIEISGPQNTKICVKFTDIKINPKLSGKIFSTDFQNGVRIIDLR